MGCLHANVAMAMLEKAAEQYKDPTEDAEGYDLVWMVEELLQGEIYDETGLDLELSRFGVDKLTRDVNKKKMSRLHPHLESAGATEKSPLIE